MRAPFVRAGPRTRAFLLLLVACGTPAPSVRTEERPAEIPDVSAQAAEWDGWLEHDVVPIRYALDLRVVPSSERFEGVARIRVRVASPRRTIWLHGRGLEVSEVVVHARRPIPARFTGQPDDGSRARIDLDEDVSGELDLEFRYRAPFTRYEGLSKVEDAGKTYVFSHLPPIAARTVFPCFDEPRFKTPFELVLRTPPGDLVFANAPERSSREVDGLRETTFEPTEPIPTYLVAMAVGPFDVVERHIPPNEVRDRALSFRGVALAGERAELAAVMRETPNYLAAIERYLGIPYPYAKLDFLANPAAEYAGMENPGAVIFESDVILTDRRGLSADSRSVVVHELAHQWFGNLVTTASWQDLWLNEGLATFLDARVREDLRPRSDVHVDRAYWAMRGMAVDRRAVARLVREPIRSSHDMHGAFDDLTYEKTAVVLHMFEGALGREAFRRGLTRYLNEHAHGSALADDFFDALAEGATRDVEPGIRSFLDQRGIPIVEARLDCAASAIRLSQRPYVPPGGAVDERTWQIPLCVRLGRANATEVQCTTLASREASLGFSRPECPSWIHPNANGSSYYLFAMPGAESQALVQRGLDRATTGERLSLVMSLVLGFDARAPNARAVLEILVDQSGREPYFVADVAASLLARLDERIVAPEDRDALRQFIVARYGGDAIRLGWSHEDGSLRGPALELLVDSLREPRAVEEAARRARRWAGLDGPAERNVVNWRYTDVVLAAGVRVHGVVMFDALEARLPVATSAQRYAILYALGSAADRALVARALALATTDALDGRESVFLLETVLTGEAYDLALDFIDQRFDDLTARLSRRGIDELFRVPDGLCTEEDARRVEQLFTPRTARGEDGPRKLAYTLDAIRSCTARVATERAALHDLL